jgi:hypothetical protein
MSGPFNSELSDLPRMLSAPPDRSALHAAETAYLDHAIHLAQARLQRLRENLTASDGWAEDDAPTGETRLVAAYRAEQRVLNGLRSDPQLQERGLEDLLADSLREADRRLMDMGRSVQTGDGYDPAFWELEQERDIRATILREWWHWLNGEPAGT